MDFYCFIAKIFFYLVFERKRATINKLIIYVFSKHSNQNIDILNCNKVIYKFSFKHYIKTKA